MKKLFQDESGIKVVRCSSSLSNRFLYFENKISTKQLTLFEKQELDAVGFVVKSSENRLDEKQKYIFNSVLSIFGKNIKDNVRFIVSHIH